MEAATQTVLGVRVTHKKHAVIGELPYFEFVLKGASKSLIDQSHITKSTLFFMSLIDSTGDTIRMHFLLLY
ncbi:hypothetical protein JK169_14285 [Acetobacter persici]|nr:hypothetical protein [Acetobacter persici]